MARLRKATKVERPPIERQTKGKPDPKASHVVLLCNSSNFLDGLSETTNSVEICCFK
jgi:hypothetical protein